MSDCYGDVDRMREDYRTVVADRKAQGLWTEADEIEAGKMIKAALAEVADDEGVLKCWADWLAREAEEIRRWESRVREVEARIAADAEQARTAA